MLVEFSSYQMPFLNIYFRSICFKFG